MKSRLFFAAICFFFLTTSMSFGYNATFLPRISVMGEYTDNVLLTYDNDLKEHDYITTVTPGFTAELVGKKGDAKLSYDVSYVSYDNFDDFNGWRHQAGFSGKYEITKNTRFNVRDNFLYTEDPLINDNIAIIRTETPTAPIDFTTIKNREIYRTNYATVGLVHQFGKYQEFRLGYNHYLINYDDPAVEDIQNHNPSVGLTYWFGPQWGFDVSGSYTRGEYSISDNIDMYDASVSLLKRFGKQFIGYIRYSHSVVKFEGGTGDEKTYNPSIGFKYDIEKDISLVADIGYFFNDSDVRGNTSSPAGDLRLIKRFEHGRLNLAALGGYDYSLYDSTDQGFAVFYEGSISLSHQLTKYVYSDIFGSYRNTDYKNFDRTDKSPTIGLGLSWEALQWMTVGLDYRFRQVDSTIDTEDYKENRVGVTITLYPIHPFHTSRY